MDMAALERLMRHFHQLAGSAGSFGFSGVGEVAARGDRECALRLAKGTEVSAAEIADWRSLVDQALQGLDRSTIEEAQRTEEIRAPIDVLIVEDDLAVLWRLVTMLEKEGATVRAAHDSEHARAAIDEKLPDAMISDVVLPDGNGLDIVRMLRATPGGQDVSVLVMSARAQMGDRVASIRAGADSYLEKPIDWEALERWVHQAADRCGGTNPRILYVEDDPLAAEWARIVLDEAGYDVRICGTSQGFEDALSEFRPDLVLLDLELPDIDGLELSRFMRQSERFVTTPIVFITSRVGIDAKIAALAAGADDHLTKPVPPELLLRAVRGRIQRARMTRTLMECDGLTRLLTHGAFVERAHRAMTRLICESSAQAAMILIDVDHFKRVNDTHGHPAGDRVLASLGAVLRRRLRRSDILGRYGGEEFVVMLDGVGVDGAKQVIDRLRADFAQIVHAGEGCEFTVTFSAGVADIAASEDDVASWIKAADRALYRAKSAGRNRVEASEEPRKRVVRARETAVRMRRDRSRSSPPCNT
jgi:diguanylate cyclase (GGDEF)-like protein